MPRQRALTAEAIRAARKDLGWSQSELAERLGVTQPTISNWESGRVVPSHDQLDVLGNHLGDSSQQANVEPSASPQANYGDWLGQIRIGKGLSRQALAAKSGISEPQIWNIETGRTSNPRTTTRRRLENALGAAAPSALIKQVEEAAEIASVGRYIDFDPHDEQDYPSEPGVYVFYDVSDRPVYVGESGNIRNRIRNDHRDKFWYRSPIVEKASYVRVEEQKLRRQLEDTMIKFLKSNAVINQRQVDRG